MDPVTLIVTALAAGAAAALKDTASQAVKDAYAGLRALVQQRLAGKPAAETALAQYEAKPKVWEEPLKDGLAEAGAGEDAALLESAQRLLKLVQPQQAAQGKYNVQIGEARGTVIGDNVHVTQNWGREEKDA